MNSDSGRPSSSIAATTTGELRVLMRQSARETVRQAILDAAEELIAEHGLRDAALAQIARRAGVAVGTLYNYFTDRDALIAGLFEARRQTFRPVLLAAIGAGSELAFEPRLRRFVRGVLEAFESHRRYLKIALENEHLKPPGSTTPQDLLDGLRAVVAAGVRDGAIAAERGELLALIVSGMFRSVAFDAVHTGRPMAADADALVEILLDGVRGRGQR